MIAALVTTLNEADTIGAFVASLNEVVDKVLVVDDPRSTDNTEAVAHAFGADTIVDLDATGIGPCLLAGFRQLRGYDVVVIDAGGSHDPYQIPALARRGAGARADVVIGSRFVEGGRYYGRPTRARLSRLYGQACSLVTGYPIKDWTSGFRWYSTLAVREILSRPPTTRMHGFQPEILARCLGAGLHVVEHPITYRAGRSSMNLKVALEAIRVLGGLRCS